MEIKLEAQKTGSKVEKQAEFTGFLQFETLTWNNL